VVEREYAEKQSNRACVSTNRKIKIMTQTKEFWKKQYEAQVKYLTELYTKSLAGTYVRPDVIQSATAQALYFKSKIEDDGLFRQYVGKGTRGVAYMPTTVDEIEENKPYEFNLKLRSIFDFPEHHPSELI